MRFSVHKWIVAVVAAWVLVVSASSTRAEEGGWGFYSNGASALDQTVRRPPSPRYVGQRPLLRSPWVVYHVPQPTLNPPYGYWVWQPQSAPQPGAPVNGYRYYYPVAPDPAGVR